jgi:hypothetical protein
VHVADDVVATHATSVSPGRDADLLARHFSLNSSRSWFPRVNRGDLRHQLLHERFALSVEAR